MCALSCFWCNLYYFSSVSSRCQPPFPWPYYGYCLKISVSKNLLNKVCIIELNTDNMVVLNVYMSLFGIAVSNFYFTGPNQTMTIWKMWIQGRFTFFDFTISLAIFSCKMRLYKPFNERVNSNRFCSHQPFALYSK